MTKKIYVADDDETIRELIPEVIYSYFPNHKPRMFEDADSLCGALKEGVSDCAMVLTDYNTKSSLNGLDVLGYARDNRYPFPFVLMSSFLEEGDELRSAAMNLGAYDCLSKPFRLEEFKSMLEKALESKH